MPVCPSPSPPAGSGPRAGPLPLSLMGRWVWSLTFLAHSPEWTMATLRQPECEVFPRERRGTTSCGRLAPQRAPPAYTAGFSLGVLLLHSGRHARLGVPGPRRMLPEVYPIRNTTTMAKLVTILFLPRGCQFLARRVGMDRWTMCMSM